MVDTIVLDWFGFRYPNTDCYGIWHIFSRSSWTMQVQNLKYIVNNIEPSCWSRTHIGDNNSPILKSLEDAPDNTLFWLVVKCSLINPLICLFWAITTDTGHLIVHEDNESTIKPQCNTMMEQNNEKNIQMHNN